MFEQLNDDDILQGYSNNHFSCGDIETMYRLTFPCASPKIELMMPCEPVAQLHTDKMSTSFSKTF